MLTNPHLSHKDRENILNKLNHTGRVAVLRQKNGHLRIYDLDKYLNHKTQMREVIRGHRPWTKRQKPMLGPIGSQALGVHSDLSRAAIYEGR